jgi:hypothetical protein
MDAGLMEVPDGGCAAITDGWVATLVTVPVSWPAAVTSGVTVTTAGTGNIQLVLLSHETTGADAGAHTGTSRTCATVLPAVQFASGVNGFVGIPSGDTGYLEISLPDSLWDNITRTTNISGSSTGWNPGSVVTTNASVGAVGLAAASSFVNPATAWPAACTSNCTPNGVFMMSDLSNDDGDGNPGVTVLGVKMLNGTNDYILPPVSASPGGASADKIYIASRTELSVSSTRQDCDTGTGTANVTLFDNHVVGCHLTTGAACTSAEASFLDTNRVVYTLKTGATVNTKQIRNNPNPTCAQARSAVGFTG